MRTIRFRRLNNVSFVLISSIILQLYSCQKKECAFDNSFLKKNNIKDLNLIISSDKNCNELNIFGHFKYNFIDYSIKQKLHIRDSLYYYNNDNIKSFLFDFTTKKRNGKLIINDSLLFSTEFFMDYRFKNTDYRFFKIKNVDSYYNLQLDKILITNYNYGIVGEFTMTRELNENMVVAAKGFIPDEKKFFSMFLKVKLE